MIPVHEPDLRAEEIEAACAAIRGGEISGSRGARIPEFEAAVAAACGVRHGVATSSGTTALQLAMATLRLSAGDEVLVPALTNIATCVAIVHAGATPVLVDSEPDTWNMDLNLLERLVTSRTRAVLPVHLYGHPVDLVALSGFAERHGLLVVEDAAEAQGATCHGRPAGGFGALGCLSFYANKVVTTGEGGMVVTDDPDLARRARSLRNLAFGERSRFLHEDCGFNFRMTNVQAALGVGQMKRLESIVERKRTIARWYLERLAGVPGLRLPVERPWARNVYWMFGLVVEPEFRVGRDELASRLREQGVETRDFFTPMNLQPAFHSRGLFRGLELPVAEALGRNGLYLPSSNLLDEGQVEFICGAIARIADQAR